MVETKEKYLVCCHGCEFREVAETLQAARDIESQHRLTPSGKHGGVRVFRGTLPIKIRSGKRTLERLSLDEPCIYCEDCYDNVNVKATWIFWGFIQQQYTSRFICDFHALRVAPKLEEEGVTKEGGRLLDESSYSEYGIASDEDGEPEKEYTVWCHACFWKVTASSLSHAEKIREKHNSLPPLGSVVGNVHGATIFDALPPIQIKTYTEIRKRIPIDEKTDCDGYCGKEAIWAVEPYDHIRSKALVKDGCYCEYHLGAYDARVNDATTRKGCLGGVFVFCAVIILLLL